MVELVTRYGMIDDLGSFEDWHGFLICARPNLLRWPGRIEGNRYPIARLAPECEEGLLDFRIVKTGGGGVMR